MQAEKITLLNNRSVIGIEYGTVQGTGNDQFVIQSQSGIFTAKRAFSCMINPEPGDKVMYSRDDKQKSHILAIIERPTHQNATMSFQGDVTIDAQQGQVSIAGRNGIQMASAEALTLVSNEMNVIANNGRVNINKATLTGDQVTSHISSVRTFARSIDTVADRLTQRLKNSFRMIDGVDLTKTGEMLTTIKNLFSVRARQSAIIAKKDIKIDAERIHMG